MSQNNIDNSTYQIIRQRLQNHKTDLQKRIQVLNQNRIQVFGALEHQLIANDRIITENNCIARDIVSLGDRCIFGYNVHFGLRTDIQLSDVFSMYRYQNKSFQQLDLSMLDDPTFISDFTNLYKYYRTTTFSRFAVIGNYLYMVFQLSENTGDIKTFKWLIKDDQWVYIDNRSDHEYRFSSQHEFEWQTAGRDQQRYGQHPHISILDKVFVETIGGDLTIKVEDNTDDGQGIFSEEVSYPDQTLDDGQIRYAEIGNLIVLEIKPFQEKARYFIYNHKLKEVKKVDSLATAAVLLPDEQGLIFPTGYYLQTGEYHLFENGLPQMKFVKRIHSPNGEDYLFVFYSPELKQYNLMSYNVINQKINTPILCSGYTILDKGELCYFNNEEEQSKNHLIQIWQTPYIKGEILPSEHQDNLLYKVGNKDIVKLMADANALMILLNKEDSYAGLYTDIAKASKDISDSYYWLNEKEAQQLNEPLEAIETAARAAIDEYEKVLQYKKEALRLSTEIEQKSQAVFGKIKSSSFKNINDFVQSLSNLRTLRGELIGLKDIRYISTEHLEKIEAEIADTTEKIAKRCVGFLLQAQALSPYKERVNTQLKTLDKIKKVVEAKAMEKETLQIADDLEMLIEIVSNLEIEDSSQSTEIIDRISLIFAELNQLKAALKNKKQSLAGDEAQAEFAAQIKLTEQSMINFLDIADSAEKCEEFLSKIIIQLEELEGKFADFDEFTEKIIEKREEIYEAFEAKKSQLIEKRNRRVSVLKNAAERILKGIGNKANQLKSQEEIHAYFAADLMIEKVRNIISELHSLQENGSAEALETQLKVAKEDTVRRWRDKQDLYEDGDNIIKLGNHKFGVNRQALDLSLNTKDEQVFIHLSGTDYQQKLDDNLWHKYSRFWQQDYVSETPKVYRSEYLAYQIFKQKTTREWRNSTAKERAELCQKTASLNYTEGYTKGVHDHDATQILNELVRLHLDLGTLKFAPDVRAAAKIFWNESAPELKSIWLNQIQTSTEIEQIFPKTSSRWGEKELLLKVREWQSKHQLFPEDVSPDICDYLFDEMGAKNSFSISKEAAELKKDFLKTLKSKKANQRFEQALEELNSNYQKFRLIGNWVDAYLKNQNKPSDFSNEISVLLLYPISSESTSNIGSQVEINDLKGTHDLIINGTYKFDYHYFIQKLTNYTQTEVAKYLAFRQEKSKLVAQEKKALKLDSFQPNVLSSFVRNRLIDQVYLPLFGDNLAKQLGTVGAKKRVDRMGLLLLISPPGYGKTTLMEYLANRLGLVFMKINGPTIGHQITSVDPMAANNSAAKEELRKLNLAFEMGDNVMLYLDDIQHCNPEFLQKFISLSDGQRKIDGVYKGEPKTYDLRGKKFCVIMAGNPYTESGGKFQIPDMLANRADIYNLGDIIGNSDELFRLSLVENSLTSNPVLAQIRNKNPEDVYALVERVEQNNPEIELEANYSPQELRDLEAVMQKVLKVRDTVLRVNATYIKSAAMDDAYRTEPTFKLQGSYRDMNKLVAKIVPVMNADELEELLLSHYESEAQTLTSATEANLLKYKELSNFISKKEQKRWEEIKATFVKNNRLKGLGNQNEMGQIINQLITFSEHLEGIKNVLNKS